MYVPAQFRQEDIDAIRALVDAAPFASLISVHGAQSTVTPVPLIMDASGRLLGHVARANPHAALLGEGTRCRVLVHGPHCHVSPTWYAKSGVPTWNYAMLDIEAQVSVLDGEAAQDLLDALTARFEDPQKAGDTPHQSREERAHLLGAIHCFALQPLQTDAKFKLSQNRTRDEQQTIVARLMQRDDENSQAIASLMLRNLAMGAATQE